MSDMSLADTARYWAERLGDGEVPETLRAAADRIEEQDAEVARLEASVDILLGRVEELERENRNLVEQLEALYNEPDPSNDDEPTWCVSCVCQSCYEKQEEHEE